MNAVLVIDDDPLVRIYLKELLELEGFSVRVAENGARGLDMCRHDPPDLVITDIIMTKTDGLSVLRTLREEFPHIPSIAISGGDRSFNPSHLLHVASLEKARAVFSKPFERTELVAAIGRILGFPQGTEDRSE